MSLRLNTYGTSLCSAIMAEFLTTVALQYKIVVIIRKKKITIFLKVQSLPLEMSEWFA